MKFKKDKTADEAVRVISLVDGEGDTLRVSSYEAKGNYDVIFDINDNEGFGLKRSKALKLAWAIIDELSPSVL